MRRINATLRGYLGALAGVLAATAATFVVQGWIGTSMSILFFPAVVLPAIYAGFGPALFATVLSTLSLAFLFIPPQYSLNIGADDAIRLAVFAMVSYAIAWVSSARRQAEEAQRESLTRLQASLNIMRKVTAWPLVIDADTAASMRNILSHGATAVGAATALAVWEAEEEPWLYVTSAAPGEETTSRHGPSLFAEPGSDLSAPTAMHESPRVPSIPVTLRAMLTDGPVASVPFETEHVSGRVFFGGVPDNRDELVLALEVVAREIGNSIAHLYVAERNRALALREDRLRVSRDLHDGVLQALTGIRLEIQSIAETCVAAPATHNRLLAAERAMAIEQRQLRTFIDGLKPDGSPSPAGTLVADLETTAGRLSIEWQTPITVRATLRGHKLSTAVEHAVRMMVHEGIVNALKHGHPSRVIVAVEAEDGELRVSVADDGRGFPFRGVMDQDALARDGVGPVTLRDRVASLGGRLSVASASTGSRVEIMLPL